MTTLAKPPVVLVFTQVPRSGEALVGCFASTGLLPRPVSRTTRAIADARRPRRSLRTDLFISSSLVGDSLRGVRQARLMVFTSYQYCVLESKQGSCIVSTPTLCGRRCEREAMAHCDQLR